MGFTKKCIYCKGLKSAKEFTKPLKKYNYANICKECLITKQVNNKKEYDRIFSKKYCKSYYNQNKQQIRDWCRGYERNRRKTDPMYKLTKNLRTRLQNSLKCKKWKKNSKFKEYIGCTLEELKYHIESKFKEGMTWDNWKFNGWHIDHIIPLSSAKTEEEMIKLCHYTNLQPLWSEDNIKKSNKYGY